MRYIDLKKLDVNCNEFKNWNKKAKDLLIKASMIDNSEKRKKFIRDNNHWTKIKSLFIENFGPVCWYSGKSIIGDYGDIDHFRPKSTSRDQNNNIILENGYWWLAYNHNNLRLSCTISNRPYLNGGKSDKFPLRDVAKSWEYNRENEEENVLIDPCNKEDTDIVGYQEDGKVICLSSDEWNQQRINISNKLYNLNEFIDERRKVQMHCKTALNYFSLAFKDNNEEFMKKALEDLFSWVHPKEPYSSVAYHYLLRLLDEETNKAYRDDLINILSNVYNA